MSDDSELHDYISNKVGWSQSGKLKTRVASTVSLQVNFPEGKASMYTVQLGVSGPNNPVFPNDKGVFRALVTVTWSVEGNTVQRIFDLCDGLTITGAGQAVHVVVNDATLQHAQGGPTNAGSEYDVTILVVPGVRPERTYRPPTLMALLGTPGIFVEEADFFGKNGTNTPTQIVTAGTPLGVILPNVLGFDVGAVSVQVLAADTSQIGGAGTSPTGIIVQETTLSGGFIGAYQLTLGEEPVFVDLGPDVQALIITVIGTTGTGQATVAVRLGIEG